MKGTYPDHEVRRERNELPEVVELGSLAGNALDTMLALDRGARTPSLLDVERTVGDAFRVLDVCLVGVGSIGMGNALRLAPLGLRSLLLVDPAPLKPLSVLTHPCRPHEIGRPKATVAAEHVKAVSPGTRVRVFEGAFEDLPTHELAGVTQVLLASDNLRAEAVAGERTLQLGLELIQASVYAPTLSAQVRVFPSAPDCSGPCPVCLFGEQEWRELDAGTIYSCSGAPSGSNAAQQAARPTLSLPQLCAIASDLGIMELTRRVVGVPGLGQAKERSQATLIDYCGFTHHTTITRLARNPACPLEHARVLVETLAGELGSWSPRKLLRRAGFAQADPQRVRFTVEGYRFARFASCGCSQHPRLGRYLAQTESNAAGHCAACDREREVHPLYVHDEVPVSAFELELDRPLHALGAARARTVWVRSENRSVLLLSGPEPNPSASLQREELDGA